MTEICTPTITAEQEAYAAKMRKHWDQPEDNEILVDDKHALMSAEACAKLCEYSASLPTGTWHGKRWKREVRDGPLQYSKHVAWYMGEYIPDPDPNFIGIKWRKIIIV